VTKRTVTIRLPRGKTATKLSLSLPRGTLKLARATKVGTKLTFAVRATTSTGKALNATVTLPARA
jgi:hypothetical protein